MIYGDTDSLFVLLEGQSRQQAFITGRQIAAEVRPLIACSLETYGLSVRIAYGCHRLPSMAPVQVTAANPHPMELEMEIIASDCL